MALRIAILGSVELRINGDVVGAPAGKQRALLTLLAVRAPHPVSAESAAAALWPRAAPLDAIRSLQVTVSRLRRSLAAAGAVVETVASGYRLAVEADAIDARRFETLIGEARVARVGGDTAAARRLLDEALGLWRGPALADVGFESFAQAEIARLEELRVAALEERLDARLEAGEHALVVAELEQLAAEHPSRERLVGLLMLALYRCGRQTDALEVYTRGRLRLDEELGLEPSAELQRLQEAILRHDPSLDARGRDRDPTRGSIGHGQAPEGVVTMLFTDIEGSTRLARAAGSVWPQLLAEHHQLVLDAVERAGGHVDASEGDALFAYFVDPGAAVEAATTAQRALRGHAWPEPVGELRVRMGVHAGLVSRTATGYSGLEVHRAARVMAAGHGGQVVVSAAARALLGSRSELVDVGEHRLKDFPAPERLWLLVHDDRGPADFPPLRAARVRPTNLPADPAPGTRLIGRERERQQVLDLICAGDARLVTLVGPGGVGKTRLAIELAGAAMPRFRDGVAWVELAAVGRAEHVPGTIGRALTLTPLPGETPEQALLRVLEANHLLLVIDNFEHVLEAAPLVAGLLAHCATLTVLATSREALDLAAEHVYPVAPLELPAGDARLTAAGIEASPAGALFLAAARRHDPSLRADDADARAIADICTRLDGLPLAIELAAARTPLLSPASLAARLDRALATLASGPRDAPERQRTLRATIDWSYRLLDPHEQAAFARFAVFAGGARLEDAEAITGADLNTLEGLARKHLLVRAVGTDGEPRVVMLETVREYARELLDAADEESETRSLHCRRYLDLATRADRHLFTHSEADWLTRLETEIDNLRAALDWALGSEPQLALRLAAVLGNFWEVGHRAGEGVKWLRAALEAAGPAAPIADRARAWVELGPLLGVEDSVACVGVAGLLGVGASLDDAIAAGPRALTLARESRDDALIADALAWLCEFAKMTNTDPEAIRPLAIEGLVHASSANDELLIARALMARAGTLPPGDQAEREYHEAAAALRNVGDRWHLVALNNRAAYNAIIHGSYGAAARLLDETLPLARESGEPWQPLIVWGNLGLVRLLTGDDAGARIAFEAQLQLCRDHNLRWAAAEGLGGLAAVAAQQHHFERAGRLLGAATAIGPFEHPDLMAKLEQQFFNTARAGLGDMRWSDAVQAGHSLAFGDAIELALAAPRRIQDRTAAHSSRARSGGSRQRS
jgi:predicted ATPase/DNA-binding SARP family transcriptional activator